MHILDRRMGKIEKRKKSLVNIYYFKTCTILMRTKTSIYTQKESEREREIIKSICEKNNQSCITHQTLPSVSITPKSMTYRGTAYLKI